MRFDKLLVVFVALTGRLGLPQIIIEPDKSDEFAELEDATIHVLRACYGNQDKTIVLLGDVPTSFVKKLTSHESVSLVLIDGTRRKEKRPFIWPWEDLYRLHKVHVFVMIATSEEEFVSLIDILQTSIYNNPLAPLLIVGWSPIMTKNTICDTPMFIHRLFMASRDNEILNAKLICYNQTKNVVIHGFNPFVNKAPKPWKRFRTMEGPRSHPLEISRIHPFFLFYRDYPGNEDLCENLDFDKTRDLGGSLIELTEFYYRERFADLKIRHPERGIIKVTKKNIDNKLFITRREKILWGERSLFLRLFIGRVKAYWIRVGVMIQPGVAPMERKGIETRPTHLKGVFSIRCLTYAYPHKLDCKLLVTQFRGNMSQLMKILSVIDGYSWYAMYVTYFVALIFFMSFLRQSLVVGIVNLIRLTFDGGLLTEPSNVSSRIFLSCFLFFILTMQGIFVGNLASLLTHEFPVRQVNSIQDLVDLGYKVIAIKFDYIYFDDPAFEGRMIERIPDQDCIDMVINDPLVACLIWDPREIDHALAYGLYVSDNCVVKEYFTNVLPWNWALQETFNEMLGWMVSASSVVPLEAMVDKQRFVELESQEVLLEPEVMTLDDLGFAFAILGVGLGFACITFAIELILYRFQNRVKTTRVIMLK